MIPSYRRRAGFTLVEILIVVVCIGILAVTGGPKISGALEKYQVQAAKERVMASVAAARASAIHTGRESVFLTSGDWMAVWIRNPTTGYWSQSIKWQYLPDVHKGVQLQLAGSGWSWVWFDPRGLAKYRPPGVTVFRVVGQSGVKDSVCVTRLGQILPNDCTL